MRGESEPLAERSADADVEMEGEGGIAPRRVADRPRLRPRPEAEAADAGDANTEAAMGACCSVEGDARRGCACWGAPATGATAILGLKARGLRSRITSMASRRRASFCSVLRQPLQLQPSQ